jgi:ubiquinone/menaquinone biosynthesis C-methylase UbiE
MSHRLYTQYAEWFELLTVPEDYVEEASGYKRAIREHGVGPIRTLLELGAGGGTNAFHLQRSFDLTLVDLSAEMLELARRRVPASECVAGDMRSIRLGREFDAILIHDAITYMISESDLSAVLDTARIHCRPGGVAIFVPKFLRETFQPRTRHGGYDGHGDDARAMRYLHWCSDPDPTDDTYTVLLTWVLRNGDQPPQVDTESHVNGMFSRATWRRLIEAAGFELLSIDAGEQAVQIIARRVAR